MATRSVATLSGGNVVHCSSAAMDMGLRLAARSCAWSPGAARDRSGWSASEELVALSRERIPVADVRVGEMEALPYEDDAFDLVTGFNSFFFADDFAGALRGRTRGEAGRPGRDPGVGSAKHNDLETMKKVARPFLQRDGGRCPGARLRRAGGARGARHPAPL